MDFIYEYFIKPIEMREAYNPINTIVYVILAILILNFLSKFLVKRGIAFMDERMIFSILPYAVAAGIIRALVDLVDAGKAIGGIYEIYKYSFWNVTPGIYIVMSSLFLFIYYLENKYGLYKITTVIGYALLVFHLFLILPYIEKLEALLALLIAYIPAVFLSSTPLQFYAYFGQGLDGASTFLAIEIIGNYSEKHVLSSLIGENFSYLVFFILKLIIVYIIDKKYALLKITEEDRRLLLGIAAILGLGIGTRNMVRIIMGV